MTIYPLSLLLLLIFSLLLILKVSNFFHVPASLKCLISYFWLKHFFFLKHWVLRLFNYLVSSSFTYTITANWSWNIHDVDRISMLHIAFNKVSCIHLDMWNQMASNSWHNIEGFREFWEAFLLNLLKVINIHTTLICIILWYFIGMLWIALGQLPCSLVFNKTSSELLIFI